jgi:hypothetical protein
MHSEGSSEGSDYPQKASVRERYSPAWYYSLLEAYLSGSLRLSYTSHSEPFRLPGTLLPRIIGIVPDLGGILHRVPKPLVTIENTRYGNVVISLVFSLFRNENSADSVRKI